MELLKFFMSRNILQNVIYGLLELFIMNAFMGILLLKKQKVYIS